MKNLMIKIKHLTLRRILNKALQVLRSIPKNFSLKKIEKKNEKLFEDIKVLCKRINDSNGSSYFQKASIKIGVITDEFMYNYYKDAVELVVLPHDNYKKIIDEEKLDLVMYISCWRGMCDNDWYGDLLHSHVPEAMIYARKKNITTVFQSIEDPTNYSRYLPIAMESDFIFTTDFDCINKYIKDTGNDNVFLLEYGVNPLFHNPIGINEKYSMEENYDHSTVFFAGSWMDRYENRCRDIRMIFDGVLHSGKKLMIADRNVEVRLPGYSFPKKYRPYVVPAIEHHMLQKIHKLFDFNININTVQDSPTMCAMRAYELQSLGCVFMTNYSLALSQRFPGLFMVNGYEEVNEILNKYSRNDIYRMQVDNLRNVMCGSTVFDRLNYIFEKCKIDHRFPVKEVAVVCKEKSQEIVDMFNRQTYHQKKLYTCEEYREENSQCEYVAIFSDDNCYGRNYLTDMINTFKYCDVPFVTKDSNAEGVEYDYIEGTVDINKTVFTTQKYEELSSYNDKITCISGIGFKIDTFGLNDARYETVDPKEIAVIVPVFNNGEYLYGRCFRSLLRSSVFDKMQIYIVDDGSDDNFTIDIIQRLEASYDNITTFYFEKGGSGSAARPRNKGVEISGEPYITYLDPDNEAENDGYAHLLKAIKERHIDMAFGAIHMRRDSETFTRIGYLFKDTDISKPRKLLIDENFRSQSIQACLIKRSLITLNEIINPVGAFGEDTLFFHELMLNAKKVYYFNSPIHIYYAQRSESSINVVGKEFFLKSMILEKYQVLKFEEYGVLQDYISKKLDYFIINWYIEKLKDVKEDQRQECIGIILDIAALYGRSEHYYKKYIEEGK